MSIKTDRNTQDLYSAFTAIIDMLNNYTLQKVGKYHVLKIIIGDYNKEFEALFLVELVQPVGEWICKLPQETKDKYLK